MMLCSRKVPPSLSVIVITGVTTATTAVVVVPVRVVLVQGPLGPEHPVTAVLAPELVAGVVVLVPRTSVHKHSVALVTGARPDFSSVLVQGHAGGEDAIVPAVTTVILSRRFNSR